MKNRPKVVELLAALEGVFAEEMEDAFAEWNRLDPDNSNIAFHQGRIEQTKLLRARVRSVLSEQILKHLDS